MLSPILAARNIVAHRQRSLIMFAVVGLVSFVVLLFMCFSDGQMENSARSIAPFLSPSADIVIYARGFKTAQDEGEEWKRISSLSIKGYSALLSEIRAMPFVSHAYTPTTALDLSVFAGGQKYKGFMFRGVDPAEPRLVKGFLRMKEGGFFDASDTPQVILHYRTATTIRTRPGERVLLQGKDLFGQVVVQEAILKGFYAPEQDMPYLIDHGFINMAAYILVSGFSPDETMSLFVDLKKGESRKSAIKALEAWSSHGGLGLEVWDSDSLPRTELLDLLKLLRLIFMAASLLLITLMTFGIMSVVSVSLFDRKREIGTYYCLGSGKGFLVRLYTLEILITNLSATAAGVLVALAVRRIVNSLGITTDVSGLQIVLGGSRLSLGLSAGSVVFVFSSILIVSMLTALTTLGARLRVPLLAALRETE